MMNRQILDDAADALKLLKVQIATVVKASRVIDFLQGLAEGDVWSKILKRLLRKVEVSAFMAQAAFKSNEKTVSSTHYNFFDNEGNFCALYAWTVTRIARIQEKARLKKQILIAPHEIHLTYSETSENARIASHALKTRVGVEVFNAIAHAVK